MTTEQRFLKLEARINRLRAYGAFMTLVFIVIFTVSATKEKPNLLDASFKTIKANKMIIVDGQGNNHLELSSDTYGGDMKIRNKQNKVVATLSSRANGGGLALNNNVAKPALTLTQNNFGGDIKLFNHRQFVTASVKNTAYSAELNFFDTKTNRTIVNIGTNQYGGRVTVNAFVAKGGSMIGINDKNDGIYTLFNDKGSSLPVWR